MQLVAGCVELRVFYNCNQCSRCHPGWKHPVHRRTQCTQDLSRTHLEMLSGQFEAPNVPCKTWSIASTASPLVAACLYDKSKITVPGRMGDGVSNQYLGNHAESKMVLTGSSACDILINSTGLTPTPCIGECPQTITVDQTRLTMYEVTALHCWLATLHWLLAESAGCTGCWLRVLAVGCWIPNRT